MWEMVKLIQSMKMMKVVYSFNKWHEIIFLVDRFLASFHATFCTDCFTNYHEGHFVEVFFGGSKSSETVGRGDIRFKLEGRGQLLSKDVSHKILTFDRSATIE